MEGSRRRLIETSIKWFIIN